ncbi:Agenet-like domain [Sesbania bispinosa]|nr:Agenet-like domain [Sesbania bispinosa]
MDYDDNDFQSQNLHLAGEGNTKFPPVLRPYALPKFDFDESLQGHLRFDSLVETEVFLGIENNEDNQWIDAYSRGSSGIGFSSTAAESCSISRHNNVWSEATSSESVEMLLKSVGQEEFIPREAVIQESDACDELACLAKQMEPNPKPDEKNEFKDNVTDLQPPSCIHESLSGSKEDIGREQSPAGVSQGRESELSIDGSLSNLKPHDMHGNFDLLSRGILLTDGKSDNTDQREVETVADGSLDEKTQDDSSASGVKTDITAASTQNISSTSDVLNIQNVQNQIVVMSVEEKSSPHIQTNKQDSESYVINKDSDVDTQTLDVDAVGGEAHHSDKPHSSNPMEEALESGSVAEGLEAGASSLEDPLNMVSDDISDSQKAERCNEDTRSRDFPQGYANEDASLIRDAVMDDQSALNTSDLPKVAIKDDSSSEGHKVEVSNSNCNTCPNFQQNVVTVEKTYGDSVSKENELLNIGNQMDTEVLLSKSEASMFAVVDNSTSTVSEGNSDSKAGGIFSFGKEVSTKSCILGEATQVCENNSDEQGDHKKICQDVSVIDQESKKNPSDSSPIHGDIDQSHLGDRGVGSSSLGAGSMETKLTTSKVSVDIMPVNNSASQHILENISSTSCEIVDVPPPPSRVVLTHEDTDHSEIQRMKLVGSASVNEMEDSEAKIAEKEDISFPVGSSEQEIAPCPVTGTEEQKFSDPSRQLLCEKANSCMQNIGIAATEKNGEHQETLSDKVDQECTKEVDVSAILCESIEKQGGEVSVSFIKDNKEVVQENHDKPCSKLSGDFLFANEGSISSSLPESHNELHETGGCPADSTNNTCGSSVTFGSPPGTEKDGNQVKPAANLNPPVSEFINKDATNILSSDHNHKENAVSKDERSLTPEVNPVADLSKEDVTDLTTKGAHAGERQPVPVIASNKQSTVVVLVEESPLASGLGTPKTNVAGNISHGSPQISDGDLTRSVSKGTPERKTRRASNKTAGKESSRKGSKGKTPARQSGKGDRSTSVSLSPSSGFKLMQSNEVQQYGHIDSVSTKPFALLNASTSSLPDLNTSASPPVLFQQPFLDIQQVQLRAQIFVYGALIQGTIPDEAYMISAFGGPDGGRSIWEKSWSLCMERQHGQKSHPINSETPLQSRSGPRTPDLAIKQSALQGKGISSPLGLASSKATPTIVNPLIPLSSPLWSLPTPSCDSLQSSALARGSVVDYSQALSSLHPYQTPPLRNFLGHNTSWISPAPLRGPWITSPAPALDNSSHLSASPVTDTIKFSSVKGSSVPPSSSIKNVPPGLPASNAGLQSVLVATSPLLDTNDVSVSHAQHSSDPKPKKRKKGMSNLGKATPASILKGANGTNSSSSIISAAKEAARRRVEAASAARKRAENMDAIVKAAELAAEAVSQAGKIVTMGDPLPLSDLVEAGPEGCWKTAQESSQQVGLLKGITRGVVDVDNVGDRPETPRLCNTDISSEEMDNKQIAVSEKSPLHNVHNEISQDQMRSIDGISSIVNVNEKSSKGPKGRKVSDLVNPIDVLPEESEIQASFTVGDGSENLEESNFKEGSLVEVFKDGEGFKAAWFTANILSLKDGKAYVCYSVLVADEGAGPLKEWVSLEGEGDKPPRIRAARPLTSFHNEGTRKRRRGTMVDNSWSVGDRVDAWIQESWQEGVIRDKNKKDKTLAVHFPASGETSVVRAWHLRPSLIWKDGKWIESPKVGAHDSPTNEGDTPCQKRPKLGNLAVELVKGKDKISEGIDAVGSANPSESRLLNLTENDKVFNIGKNSKNENKPGVHRMVRTGLQKEGSRVIFGVPKPGKKRKFMEVSKHYVADGTSKFNDGNDSVKLANFLIPQGSGSRGWKNSSKNDAKEKPGADSKPTSKSGRPQSVLGRVIPSKGNSHTNNLTSRTERSKDSSSHFKNASQSENPVERASNSGTTGAGAGPILYSSLASSTDSQPTKRTSTSRASKGKLAPAGGRVGKVEVEKASNGNMVKSTSEVIEPPRRSNRKIQPTSRLLEGLQSSLIISKIPSGSHDKGHKTQNRNNTSKGNIGMEILASLGLGRLV